jgi:hypothetical protein
LKLVRNDVNFFHFLEIGKLAKTKKMLNPEVDSEQTESELEDDDEIDAG